MSLIRLKLTEKLAFDCKLWKTRGESFAQQWDMAINNHKEIIKKIQKPVGFVQDAVAL